MDNFALRCFNSLAQDREIRGVQVASILLRLPSYYTLHSKFVQVNLWWLRRYVRAFQPPETAIGFDRHAAVADEPCTFHKGDTVPMLVQARSKQDALPPYFELDPSHPKFCSSVQRLASSNA
ncbi:hypothetical protein FE257_002406 [Aspergillus nanangensis]|uniref:Uncharacterized protein n=1 Tax=Aspergillus nanangensis TaxID=2582783 RepID=A0AAD4CD09_ASPNN|nr:hypothetical protein FE257_002406 [Aspergillus nanangensis]